MSAEKIHYPEVCHMTLDEDGGYYCRHVAAMTREGLHSKSDIAGQLAWRDREIDQLRASTTPQWQPISTAPRDGSRIMLWDSRDGGFPTFGSWRAGSEEEHGTITHWLPLPAPPEGE